jgi:hypothetical protein
MLRFLCLFAHVLRRRRRRTAILTVSECRAFFTSSPMTHATARPSWQQVSAASSLPAHPDLTPRHGHIHST